MESQGVLWKIYTFYIPAICIFQKIAAIKPYSMKKVYIDHIDGSVCRSNEFTTVQGIAGYISSHDLSLPTYKSSQQCFLTIEAPQHYRIIMQAVQFNLGYPLSPDSCNGDSLFVFDNQPENGKIFDSNLDMLGEFCETIPIRELPKLLATSSNNSITLYWHATELTKRHQRSQGFQLRWFVVRKSGAGGCDQKAEFTCSSDSSCIPAELACDADMHCPDGSDLIKKRQVAAGCENIEADSVFEDFSGAAIVGLVTATVTLTLLTAVLLARCCLHKGKSARQRQSKSNCSLTYRPAPTAVVVADSRQCQQQQRHVPSYAWAVNNGGDQSSDSINAATSAPDQSTNLHYEEVTEPVEYSSSGDGGGRGPVPYSPDKGARLALVSNHAGTGANYVLYNHVAVGAKRELYNGLTMTREIV